MRCRSCGRVLGDPLRGAARYPEPEDYKPREVLFIGGLTETVCWLCWLWFRVVLVSQYNHRWLAEPVLYD